MPHVSQMPRAPQHLPPSVCQWRELHGGGGMGRRMFGNHRDIWKSEQPQGHEQDLLMAAGSDVSQDTVWGPTLGQKPRNGSE